MSDNIRHEVILRGIISGLKESSASLNALVTKLNAVADQDELIRTSRYIRSASESLEHLAKELRITL
jgi:hypothetical protein